MTRHEALQPGLFRQPDVSADHLTFVYAGDIWLANRDGTNAQRLTKVQGRESFPRFSPCGSLVAFSADYGGNQDLYVIPTRGGVPERITWHPGTDTMIDWHPEGDRILFASDRETHTGIHNHLFEISRSGGIAQRLPIPFAADGAYAKSAGGRFLAFGLLGRNLPLWRGYRGGLLRDLFVCDSPDGAQKYRILRLTESSLERPTDAADEAQADRPTFASPMWHGDHLYCLSDQPEEGGEAVFNLWVFRDLIGWLQNHGPRAPLPTPQRVTSGHEDIRFPAMGPDEIVFARGNELQRISLADEPVSSEPESFEIDLLPDRSALVPGWSRVDDLIESYQPSPDGTRLLVSARGSIFDVPLEAGTTRPIHRANLDRETAERSATWVDTTSIAFHSDAGGPGTVGEYDFVVQGLDGKLRGVEPFEEGFRFRITVATGQDRAVFFDHRSQLWLADLSQPSVALSPLEARAERLTNHDLEEMRPSFSSCGRFLAFYDRGRNGHLRLKVLDLVSKRCVQLTSGFFSDRLPAFDPEGRFLYFVSQRGFGSLRSELGGKSLAYYDTDRLVRVPLQSQSATSIEELFGRLEDFESGIEILPLPPRQIERLVVVDSAHVVLQQNFATAGASDSLVLIAADDSKPLVLSEELWDFEVASSERPSTLVLRRDDQMLWLDLEAALQGEVLIQRIDLGGVAKTVDRRFEWHQIFRESWRLGRDFFHDRQRLHDIGWDQLFREYDGLVQRVATREELNALLNELFARIGSSHTGVMGGDAPRQDSIGIGLLGADLTLDDRALRVTGIPEVGRWLPEVRSPLREKGIEKGTAILAIDGVAIDVDREPWAALVGKAGRRVRLRIHRPEADHTEEVEIETLPWWEERILRLLAWIESNRRLVHKRSKGRLGYIYIPNTEGRSGQLYEGRHLFERQLRAQLDRSGLVIDVRFNLGGPLPHDFIEELSRHALGGLTVGGQNIGSLPLPHSNHHRVLLTNGWSASAAELLALFFECKGLGQVVGSRTLGGIDYMVSGPSLIDGGRARVANTIHIDPRTGESFAVEGEGLRPDLPIPEDLHAMLQGRDKQLEKAVDYLLRGRSQDASEA